MCITMRAEPWNVRGAALPDEITLNVGREPLGQGMSLTSAATTSNS